MGLLMSENEKKHVDFLSGKSYESIGASCGLYYNRATSVDTIVIQKS